MPKKYLSLAITLKKLLFNRDMKPIDLAREVNLPPPTIHRLITGKSTRPYKSSLKPIAEFFSLTIEELTGESKALDEKPMGISQSLIQVPVVSLNEIPSFLTNDKNIYEKVPFVGNISALGYAAIMPDSSMEPLFPKDSLLIFDPKKSYVDRSYVLVKLHDTNTPIFRQILIDAGQKYLKPGFK